MDNRHLLCEAELRCYEQSGYIHSIPILDAQEANYYRNCVGKACQAFGNNVTRFDGAHFFFEWAWALATHSRMLDSLERLLGPDILLKNTRFFCKWGNTTSFVGWHQDGFTDQQGDGLIPTVWLGLTPATIENGCLRVIPSSHRLGLVPHPEQFDQNNLTKSGTTAQVDTGSWFDVVMNAGEMSIHDPLTLHSSGPGISAGPRIGFSASYATPQLISSRSPVVWARGGHDLPDSNLTFSERPEPLPIAEAAELFQRNLKPWVSITRSDF